MGAILPGYSAEAAAMSASLPDLMSMRSIHDSKAIRAAELILVLGVAFSPAIFASLNSLLFGSSASTAQTGGVVVFYGIINELLALAVLSYVVFRQGRSFKELGLSFKWKDVPVSILLAIIAYVAFYFCYVAIYFAHHLLTGRVLLETTQVQSYFTNGISVGTVLFVALNPFYEEMIVRAYTISEMKYLTGSSIHALGVSVTIQTLYHLYQGVPAAFALGAMFFVLSVYYLKYERILPIILAHLYFDTLAMFLYARR